MTDFTYNIPNSIKIAPINEHFALYVRYPSNPSYWTKFIVSDDNKHQLEALKIFINANVDSMNISIPHSVIGIFTVKFQKIECLNDKYNCM
jgi:hypothetical protein